MKIPNEYFDKTRPANGQLTTESLLTEVFKATPHLLKFRKNKLWIDYDGEADGKIYI